MHSHWAKERRAVAIYVRVVCQRRLLNHQRRRTDVLILPILPASATLLRLLVVVAYDEIQPVTHGLDQ
jgi:hypothetical protein